MDFEKFVKPFTDYLTFSIAYWSGDPSALGGFKSLTEISPEAFLLSVIGLGFYLLIRYAKFGFIPSDNEITSKLAPPLDSNSLILFSIFSLTTPILLETSFYILQLRPTTIATPIAQTFNASFISSALIFPISGLTNRLNLIHHNMQKIGGQPAKIMNAIHLFLSIFAICIMATYGTKPFLILLNVGWKQFWQPLALSFLGTLLLIIPTLYFLYHWNLYLQQRR